MAEFVKAVRTAELVPGKGTVVELNGVRIAIFNVDGVFYAMNDTCTHASGPLSEGELDGTVVCWSSEFCATKKTVFPRSNDDEPSLIMI